MSASAAIADPLLRRASGRRDRPSDPLRTARVSIGSSGLRAPVSRRGSAISRRTVMNNAGWNWGHMEATSGETNGRQFPGSFLDFPSDHEEFLGNPSMIWRQVEPLIRDSEMGWSLMIFCARATRGLRRPSPGLMARPGKSIAKQSEGRAGEKYLPVCGRVRMLCTVGGLLAPFLKKE